MFTDNYLRFQMKFIFTSLLFLFTLTNSAQNYKQVKIYLQDRDNVQYLQELGLEFDHAEFTKDNAIIVFLSNSEFSLLKSSGYNYEVIIENWFEYYKDRPQL